MIESYAAAKKDALSIQIAAKTSQKSAKPQEKRIESRFNPFCSKFVV
jgi:hypothetical protein